MKNNRIARLITGLVLLAVFAAVLVMSVKNYDLDRLLQDAQPKTVVVTVEVTVTPGVASPEGPVTGEAEGTEPEPEPTVDPNSPEGRAAALGLPAPPDIDITGWEFLLANPSTSIAEYVPPELVTLEGQQFDSRIIAANFRRVCENNGITDGKDSKGFYITLPAGYSEHQSGLCCDITDRYYPTKNRTIEETALYKWMSVHCQEYGFIVRFPDGKEEITEIMYEPWHFRYVGKDAAEYIMANGLTLEEFLGLYTA